MIDQVLDHTGKEISIEAFHPGEYLLDEIVERGLKKKEAALKLEILPHHLSEIFAGKRNISAKLAIRLERLLDISAEFWLGMQMEYDLQVARDEAPADIHG